MNDKVVNFNQAVSVLMQAADHGRKAGIFEFDDLELISQSIKLINAISEEQKRLDEEAKAKAEESSEELVDAPEAPAAETKEVVLEPSKD